MLTYEGSNFFRQRLVLATLSGKPIVIRNIRSNCDEPGLMEHEANFIHLLDSITNGTTVVVNETGTTVKYNPGLLIGGKLEHDCSVKRSTGYYLEALLCLAPFCKKALNITLRGITNDNVDPTVDAIKLSSIPVLKRFIIRDEGLDLKIVSRGMAPEGGGEVIFQCPVVTRLRPVKLVEPGKIKRIRGVAYSVRVSPTMATRMVDRAKGMLLKFLPDVYIYTDHYKGKNSGRSPGFGLTLVAETTAGAFLSAEAVSRPSGSSDGSNVPEDIAELAVHNLLEEIYRGGYVDSLNQSMACLFLALGDADVSKLKTGPLSPYTIEFLRHLEDFMQLRMKLETEHSAENLRLGSQKVIMTCVGIGFSNLSKITS